MREFQTITTKGSLSNRKYKYIPGPVRELVSRNGVTAVEYRDREMVTITERPTPVPDSVAEELVKLPAFNQLFTEVTGVKRVAAKAADDLHVVAPKPKRQKPAKATDPSLQEVEDVADITSAVQFLMERGASAEDVQDKEGRANKNKIVATAKRMGYSFPNY